MADGTVPFPHQFPAGQASGGPASYPPGGFGGFPGAFVGRNPLSQGYMPVSGAETTTYNGPPSGLPFAGPQTMAPAAFLQTGGVPPLPLGTWVPGSLNGVDNMSSMRYYDQRLQARSPHLLPDKLDLGGAPRQETGRRVKGEDSSLGDEKHGVKPARKSGVGDAGAMATAFAVFGALAAIGVAALAGWAAWCGFAALQSDNLLTFAALASGGPHSFYRGAELAFIVMACLALLAAVAGCLACVSPKPKAVVFQASGAAVALLGIALLVLALVTWLLGRSAKPSAVRSVNLICQDVRAWSCPVSGTLAASVARLLEEVSRHRQGMADGPPPLFSGMPPLGDPRRLAPADSAIDYVHSFNGTNNASTGTSARCQRVAELCTPPLSFHAATACVCNGFWRRPGENSTGSSVGQWNGTEGAYCARWTPEEAPWCFVSPLQTCSNSTRSVEVGGQTYVMSSGPCTREVDSRSQLVLAGYRELLWSLLAPALLGLLLLLLACLLCAAAPRRKAPDPKAKPEDEEEDSAEAEPGPSWDDKTKPLETRFKVAQKEAMHRLRDATPQDLKLLLYGFYDQARYGDVRGSRPGWFSWKERSKYDAWAKLKGMSKDEAMHGYIKAAGLLE